MRARWPLVAIVLIAGLVILGLGFPGLLSKTLGLVRHEAFFDGQPTSYWVRGFKKEPFLSQDPPPGDIGKTLKEGGAAAVPVLCEMVESSDPRLRLDGLMALSQMGPEARAAEPVLVRAIKTEKESRFLLAGQTLARLDPSSATSVLGSVAGDKEDQGDRRSWALGLLLDLAPNCQGALPVLKELADNPSENVLLRVAAMHVLWRLKQPAEPLIPMLCEVAAAQKSPAGVQALAVLGEMGPAAQSAVPKLIELVQRPTLPLIGPLFGPAHRLAVALCLEKIGLGAGAAVPALLATAHSSNGNLDLRIAVALALAEMGPTAKKVVAVRDLVWGASIVLPGSGYMNSVLAPGLVEMDRKTWVPQHLHDRPEIRAAIGVIDPRALYVPRRSGGLE
jgi:HEAT repeat protein